MFLSTYCAGLPGMVLFNVRAFGRIIIGDNSNAEEVVLVGIWFLLSMLLPLI